jgi:hypothetical protein
MRVLFGIAFCIFAIISTTLADSNEVATEKDDLRNKKVFSLFSIVTFPNAGCASQDASRNGTCYTSSECQNKGGTTSGNCAAGFGVCCLFIVTATSTTISENCTYIQNPSFPSVYSDTTALTYTVNKCASNVCNVRLDFETFATAGPALTTEITGGVCVDSFVVSGTSGLSSPVICGNNAGQHIYMEMGNTGSTDTATLAFTFSGTSTIRTWEIKATQIPCGGSHRPPDGCLQYHTTLAGRFQTFNFAAASTAYQHLASQEYQICIRQEAGYCCIEYSSCSDTSSWTIDNAIAAAMTDTLCALDYVGIDGLSDTCNQSPGATIVNKFCGQIMNTLHASAISLVTICDCVPPFNVQIHTDAVADAISATAANRGVCFDYRQIPC